MDDDDDSADSWTRTHFSENTTVVYVRNDIFTQYSAQTSSPAFSALYPRKFLGTVLLYE
jgi:hypothetical protein